MSGRRGPKVMFIVVLVILALGCAYGIYAAVHNNVQLF